VKYHRRGRGEEKVVVMFITGYSVTQCGDEKWKKRLVVK
jgi:hypothetical protein